MPKLDHRILIVDDQADIRELLSYNLSKEGYDVRTTSDGFNAIKIAHDFLPDLILLDIMMPKQDGIETCQQIRNTPKLAGAFVIFLTARSEEYSEVMAFEAGADDYLTKPIKPRALISRINAHFRKQETKSEESESIYIGDLVIDPSGYKVIVRGVSVNLPKKEFEMLHCLAEKPGHIFSREALLKKVWGTEVYVLERTVDVHVRKVREKIGEGYIHTVKGVGYKFDHSS